MQGSTGGNKKDDVISPFFIILMLKSGAVEKLSLGVEIEVPHTN
jgi:hypothetical protein